MNRIHLGLVFTIAIIFSSCATNGEKTGSSPAPTATASMSVGINAEQELRAINQEYDKAIAQQDAAAFERLLADDFTLTDHTGKVIPKAELIAIAKSGDFKVEEGKSEDVKIRIYDNMALVTGRWIEKSTNKGKKFDGTMQYTTVYVKRNGKWQNVSDHATVIPPQKLKS